MNIAIIRKLSYDEVRSLFRKYLKNQELAKSTKATAYTDAFYIWRNRDQELFWDVVTAENFEKVARKELLEALNDNSSGNVESLVNGYLSHLRRFRLFLASNDESDPSETLNQSINKQTTGKQKGKVIIPDPTVEQVDRYLQKWNDLENYSLQEQALEKLFKKLCPNNNDINDVLLKSVTLNDFYSTNIFSIYPVAKHIISLGIDERLQNGDVSLVSDLQYVKIGDTFKNFYSFATKYCSHHNPYEYPIYDSYVDKVLSYFRDKDRFSDFQATDLKNYPEFKRILIEFQAFYGLDKYNLKQLDQYLWLFGKEHFPINYKKKKKQH